MVTFSAVAWRVSVVSEIKLDLSPPTSPAVTRHGQCCAAPDDVTAGKRDGSQDVQHGVMERRINKVDVDVHSVWRETSRDQFDESLIQVLRAHTMWVSEWVSE